MPTGSNAITTNPGAGFRMLVRANLPAWIIGIAHNCSGSKEWNEGITVFSRHPPKGRWEKTNDEIPRGSSLYSPMLETPSVHAPFKGWVVEEETG